MLFFIGLGLLAPLIWLFFKTRLHWVVGVFLHKMRWLPTQKGQTFQAKWRYFKPWHQGTVVYGPKKYRLSVRESMKHTLVIGGSGAGKTRKVIMPSIYHLARSGHSMLIFDPSGEILAKMQAHLKAHGYAIQSLNLLKPNQSQGYNPLSRVKSALEVGEMARILIRSSQMDKGDPFWHNGAEQMLEVVFHALLKSENVPTLRQALVLLQNFQDEATQKRLKKMVPLPVQEQLLGLLSSNPRVLSSFHAVAINALRMLNVPEISELLSRDEIDFQRLRQEKTALFLLLPIEKISYYGFIMNLFYTQFFNAMMIRLPKPGEKAVFAMLDEFSHGSIESMDSLASVLRKYMVSLTLVIQSMAQLRTRYGSRAKTLVQNCQTKVVFDPPDGELRQVLNLSGYKSPQRPFCQIKGQYQILL